MNLEYYNVKKLIDLAFEKLVNTLGGHGFGSNFYVLPLHQAINTKQIKMVISCENPVL